MRDEDEPNGWKAFWGCVGLALVLLIIALAWVLP